MRAAFFALLLVFGLSATEGAARMEILTEQQKEALAKAERLLVEVIAITDRGSVDPGPIQETVVRRLKEVGYQPVTDQNQPHDVVFRVKCEQRKVWEGTSRSGGDADLPDSPSRVWKGPACQLVYLLDGQKRGWHKEVRTDFQDAAQAAQQAKAEDPGAYAMAKLKERLEQYDFPVIVTAEWGQEARLLKLLDDPATPSARRVVVINQLGAIFSKKAVPSLLTALRGKDLAVAKAAAIALGNIGDKQSLPALIEAMRTGTPELRPEAAKALGILGALHGETSVIPPLLEALKTDDLAVKTEVVWALGKVPDKVSYEPLYKIYKTLQNVRDNEADAQVKKLKEALNWSLKQIDTWEYIQ
jgi:hypothetical protein